MVHIVRPPTTPRERGAPRLQARPPGGRPPEAFGPQGRSVCPLGADRRPQIWPVGCALSRSAVDGCPPPVDKPVDPRRGATPPVPRHTGLMHVRPVGRSAGLVEVGDAATALALATWARTAGVEALEVVPAAQSVLFDGVPDLAALSGALQDWAPSGAPVTGKLVQLAVVYDGPDLDAVAAAWGTDAAGVVRRHTA